MRFRNKSFIVVFAAGCAGLALYPALAQKNPQSILPPGFGEPAPPPDAAPPPPPKPSENRDRPARDTPAGTDVPDVTLRPPSTTLSGPSVEEVDADESGLVADNAIVAAAPQQDLPPQARRSLDQVGLLGPGDGGFGAGTFGNADGRYLSVLMDRAKAPIASRWASILLRRALLSQSAIPASIGGADWVAHRAWLLVRMGEADNARALIQRVDADNYTPWLYEIAMQASLASADPAVLCGVADAGDQQSDKPAWTLVRAMCSGLSGEGASASSLVSQARSSRKAGGIDVLLAEKVVGAGTNTRRAITIQWDGVDRLTAWRFGLATATGVPIPQNLYATAGPQVRAWAARAPLMEPGARAGFADRAATLGVFSSAALVDLYSSIYDEADPADRSGSVAATLRAAYLADPAARILALKSLWTPSGNAFQDYARSILTARAAAMIPTDASIAGEDLDHVIASMFAAGLDLQATRWTKSVDSGSLGWAMLAVGAPRPVVSADAGAVESFGAGNPMRAQFLFAGLAGLGRLPRDDVTGLAESLAVPIGQQSTWTQALDRAVLLRQPGTVALLAATGLQTTGWAYVPPAHLYRIVDALRRVGLEPEARMIAAEALARS
jgi:hypothetical protein